MRSFLPVPVTTMLPLSSLARALALPALAALLLSGCGAAASAKSPLPLDTTAERPVRPPAEEPMPSFLRVGSFLPPDEGAATAAAVTPAPTPTTTTKAAEPPPPPIHPVTPAAKPVPPGDEARTESETPAGRNEKKSGTLKAAVVDSQGGLSEADVRAAIANKHASFRRCYELGKAASADFAGSVVLRVSISPAGNVASVDVLSSTTRNAGVDTCVRDEVRVLQFKSTGAGAVVAFPLEFAR